MFRGKTLLGNWVEGDLLQYLGYGKAHIVQHYKVAGGQEVVTETVGQYTGLTDKNGKKIFEGDVLKYIDEDGEPHYISVIFEDCAFLIDDDGVIDADLLTSYVCLGIEVIGNKWYNPELLKSGEE